ncbi:MAG TPA: beta-galactosidase trimerization domain-containing protein [Candidatus Brocadiia bacterium]|nr:beta-galactosidase trimerization domain-containing protein [Candidatus Brocadiia bacterium]
MNPMPKWYWFFDFHTMPACPGVGARFDFDAFAGRLKDAGVDYIVFPARCNLGMAYYDTKIGLRHPSLKYDLLARLLEACHKRGIALSAYINVGLSHEEGLRHRDWLTVSPEGCVYRPERMDHFFRTMCCNSPYAEHLLAMVRELVSTHAVDGLFLDCMGAFQCVGAECVQEMKAKGLDWNDAGARQDFAEFTMVRIARRIAEAARSVRQNLLLYFNGVNYADQLDIATHLEYECLPTGGWGYDIFPVYSRYMRTLGLPVYNMTGRFHRSWGDFGGIRSDAGLEYDCAHALAQGLRVCVGDHMHPRGDINKPVMDLVKRVYGSLQALEPWTEGARPLADTAIVTTRRALRHQLHRDEDKRAREAVLGATRALCEIKAQFDVVTEDSVWQDYDLLVLPDETTLDGTLLQRVKEHLARGGAVLSSAWSGLDAQRQAFALPEAWGVRYEGPDPFDPAYLLAGDELGLPDMPVTLYDRGTAIAAQSAQVLARIGAPYYNRHWDGEHGFLYLPPDRPTNRPAVVHNGRVAHVSHPIFTTYYRQAPLPMRQLAASLMARLLPRPLLRTEGLPSFARATVTAQPGRRMIHLLSYVPERRGAAVEMVEEPVELRGARVALRVDGPAPARAYLAPRQEPLEIAANDGYAWVTIPRIPGRAVVVFEDK